MAKKTRTLRIRGGPTGAHMTELSLDGENIMENAYSFKLTADVEDVVTLELGYKVIDCDIEVQGDVKHVLMLQRTVWRDGPDGETSPYVEHERVTVGDGLPDALRRLADEIEGEETPVH